MTSRPEPGMNANVETRRTFLRGVAGIATAGTIPLAPAIAREAQDQPTTSETHPPGDAPISSETFLHAEKLAGVRFTDSERATLLKSIEDELKRRLSRRSIDLPNELAPASVFDPRLPGAAVNVETRFVRSDAEPGPLPVNDEDIAFSPLTHLSRWIERRQLTSSRLTQIYLERLKRLGPTLECVVTLTEELALQQARRADAELASGRWRGPLHGIPWGAKDLLDTAGIRTTWGAEPYVDRVPTSNAAVVDLLEQAGAVLVAKLTLGALAYGDFWFDGKTRSPWDLSRGSSGSSAGSASATAAGLVGFSIGTETYGSIVSPSMVCGTTGLRPTFGRVSRRGAMALCWSLDKIGPICRTVEDCALVLNAINGHDASDASSIDMPLHFDAGASLEGLRIGFAAPWFDGKGSTDVDRAAIDAMRRLPRVNLIEIDLPDWPYDSLLTILLAEAASAFEQLTLTNRDDELDWQEPEAWPNTFRQTWFTPAIDLVQADRFRRRVMHMMAEQFAKVDVIVSPSFAANLLLITNMTGHPCLTLRAGFEDEKTPRGITLWGRLFHEGTLCRLGMMLERELGVWDRRPPL
jgi:Asp-tRNA(Asn)/Glu-tRNA(Gln) amidotransferase A subunit family amidase